MPKNDPLALARKQCFISWAIARDEPIGVVCLQHNRRLSQLYLWNIVDDTFSPGQFIKGGASVLRISNDARYFVYSVFALHKRAQTYTCIAKPPYFSALAFYPHASYSGAYVKFGDNDELLVLSEREDTAWVGDFDSIQERVTPGCPFNIVREGRWPEKPYFDNVRDPHKDRRIWSEVNKLFAQEEGSDSPILLKEFTREPFVAIEPPNWAKEW